MIPEQLEKEEIVLLECVKNFKKEDFEDENFMLLLEPFMKKGWTTWAEEEHYGDSIVENCLIIENNEYDINFPPKHFKRIY